MSDLHTLVAARWEQPVEGEPLHALQRRQRLDALRLHVDGGGGLVLDHRGGCLHSGVLRTRRILAAAV